MDFTPCEDLPSSNFSSLSIRIVFSSFSAIMCLSSSLLRSSFSCTFWNLSFFALAKSCLSMMTPSVEGGAFMEASFTSPALSPKIARSSFSSGVGSDSPLGVILPIRMSPSRTRAPTRMIPFSSRSLVASSDTFGISLVSSSSPSFVSRTSSSKCSMCSDVKISSRTTRSDSTMASSKLKPFQGMNATIRFCPRASSPRSVA